MKWRTAFKWAIPLWAAMMAGVAALIFLGDDTPAGDVIWRYALFGILLLSAIAWLGVKKTADDFAKLGRSLAEDRQSER